MSFFGEIKKRVNGWFSSPVPAQPVREAGGGTSGQITNANIGNFVVKAVGNIEETGSGDFARPEYDLDEIKKAVEADSYIKLAVNKYSQLVFKAGYNIVSNNDAAAEYVTGRLNLMSFMTKTPIDIIFQQIADDIVMYSNAFLIKSRIDMTNIGGLTAKGVLNAQPVGGYFRVDPTTIQIKRDKNGTVKNYQQEVGNTTKSYKPEDVVHFYIDKPGGAAFGVPRLEAALEDVKMLRKIEGNAMKLIYRFAQPLYQMKIGLPEAGLMATSQEIKEARSEIEKLSDDGILITNERTEFNAIGAEGTALDISQYLKYFESRVFSALSLSPAMVGRGGAKQDADSMEEQIHDTVKFLQKTIATFIVNNIFFEILLEGGYNPVVNADDIVWFQFNEINLDTRVKMENHALNQFQGGALTFEEMRSAIGMYTDAVDESRLYANMIQQKNALELVNAKISASGGTVTANSGSSGPDKKTKTSGTTKNIVSPRNQNGTSSAHIKENLSVNESSDDKTAENISHYKKNFSVIYKKFSAVRNDICDNADLAALVLPLGRDGIAKSLGRYILKYAAAGGQRAEKDAGRKPAVSEKLPGLLLQDRAEKVLDVLFRDIRSRLKKALTRGEREAVFNSLEYRLRFLTENIAVKAYWYGYVKTCAQLDIPEVYVNFGLSDDKKEHHPVINTRNFSLDDIPAYNAYCTCRVELSTGGEKK